ncbi:hypothetical protein G6O67_002255 [Ophiocordyceps sinensis]|uniref:Uncharacterized protein n=1 Tax=Ophiocordyceps sinensis TaxID=72228 RepID=A0A8H4V7D1_9HYPO|nr:hypothetical protein G6O67_002255 [Ophiocordyceps sinensis]
MASVTTARFTPPATQRAIVNDRDTPVIWDEAPCPLLSPDGVYVRTETVAINPIDAKMVGLALCGSVWHPQL